MCPSEVPETSAERVGRRCWALRRDCQPYRFYGELSDESRGKVGIVVMQRPRGHDLDSVVVLSLRDWIELHGPVRVGAGAGLLGHGADDGGGLHHHRDHRADRPEVSARVP